MVSDTGAALFAGRLADRIDERGSGDVETRPLHRLGRGHPRGAARRPRLRGHREGPLLLRRPAPAPGAGPRARRRPGDPGAGRADQRGRRPHRGPDRGPAARPPRRPDAPWSPRSSPLLLDAVDEVAFLVDGRVVAVGTHADLLAERRRLPPRRRTRRGGGGSMSVTTRLPIADGRAVRRYVGQVAHRHPRLLWTALGLHVLAALTALAAPRLLGDLVQAVEEGTTRRHVDRIVLLLAVFLVAAVGADPLRPLPLAGDGRAGAGRAPRGLRRQHPGAARRHRRGGRLRRPADPHRLRHRPARLVGALGAAGVDDRGRHRGAHLRRRAERRLVGGAALPARRCRRS